MSARKVAAAAVLALVASCTAQGDNNPNLQSLDRPTDVAFACSGRLRITDGQPATPAQAIDFSLQPAASCRIWAKAAPGGNDCTNSTNPSCVPVAPPGECCDARGGHCGGIEGDGTVEAELCAADVPPGQQAADGQPSFEDTHSWYAFILQSVAGTVAVAEADVKKPGEGYLQGDIVAQDATPLTPGKNSLSVGSMPIGIAPDASGCHMVTANAGSCDLSIIDAERAINRSTEPTVRRQAVTTPGGAAVRARPAALLAAADERLIGRACPAEPDGLFFVAYPDCHVVAVVRADTGVTQASIRFADDGTATIEDGEIACPAECDGEAITDGARPITLDVVDQSADPLVATTRLAIGLDNRPVVTVVDLDIDWRPVSIEQVELSGDVGLLDVAISPQIGVGGNGPDDHANNTDQAQFVYGVATDGSVRVAEVFDSDTECDTQIDPRFLLDVGDASLFTCIPVGLPGSPPRRGGAEGPGIRIPGDAVPVSVVIARSGLDEPRTADAVPTKLIGTFAYIGLSSGIVAIANVDDDNYDDLQLTAIDPLATQLALAMPHQLRDSIFNRVEEEEESGVREAHCKTNPFGITVGAPRAQEPPAQILRTSAISADKGFALPFLRQLDCEAADGHVPVSEVSINAPIQTRLDTFPDWRGLEVEENWTLTWEGTLSGDGAETSIDGPVLRTGYVEVAGGGIKVHDAARPFCQVGVEDRDTIVLRGCDPTRGNAQCGPGQTCYVHPDSTQASGACLPSDRLPDLVSPCRDFLISSRRYAVKRAFADTLELIERRRTLRTTPVDGCTSATQCQMLATYEDSLRSDAQPVDDMTPDSTRTFACEPDPSRPPINGQNINRCVQTCTASSECGAGGKCSGGYCLEAPVPPPACVVGLQRYEVQASDAFVVLGSAHGYLHPMIADPGTGRCVKDPAANPLLLGRVPLTAPPCSGDGVADVTPNPCTIDVEQTDEVPTYTPGTCTQTDTTITTRTTKAVRFRNPAMNLNIVDTTYPGDLRCLNDRGGSLGAVPTVYPGYQIRIHQVAGFSTMAANSVRASYLSRLVLGPDRGIWVVDEGDVSTSLLNARGALFRFSHDPLGAGIVLR